MAHPVERRINRLRVAASGLRALGYLDTVEVCSSSLHRPTIRLYAKSGALRQKRQTVEALLTSIEQVFGEIEIAISAITLAELVHGVARANSPEIRTARRAFIDELKRHVPVHPVTDTTAEVAGRISGEQAAMGISLPTDDLLIGASALEQGYAVGTLNVRHFEKIPGLRVLFL